MRLFWKQRISEGPKKINQTLFFPPHTGRNRFHMPGFNQIQQASRTNHRLFSCVLNRVCVWLFPLTSHHDQIQFATIAGISRKGCNHLLRKKLQHIIFFISKILFRLKPLMESIISVYCTRWSASTSGWRYDDTFFARANENNPDWLYGYLLAHHTSDAVHLLTNDGKCAQEFYMYETVAVAIKINERGETLTSSVVDDVFYILQKCARRASETGEKRQMNPTFSTLECYRRAIRILERLSMI
jgi:hypothetical protein